MIDFLSHLDLIIDVGGEISRPLEEYMGFARNKTEKVVAFNAAGVKSGYCAAFAVVEKVSTNLIPTLTNVSMVLFLKKLVVFSHIFLTLQLATDREWKDKAWVEDPPSRILYVSPYKKKVEVADNTNC